MPEESERDIRLRLDIPEDAPRALIFAESSHWDPDWLLTSEEYYFLRIRSILNKVVRVLLKDPRRVFSVESIFFFKMYWDRNPNKRETLRFLANQGRIRFSGTGFTQPDTMIPSTEAIIRDFQLGQRWMTENGIEAAPRIAYVPDDFGLSPAFPSILNSLGMKHTAGSRIDGHYILGAESSLSGRFPLPGSSAELLLKDLKTIDIIWRAGDGSEVIYHFNPMTYDHGGMIAAHGVARLMNLPVSIPARSEKSVAKKIGSYVKDLSPYSKTPYMFCPIGSDFTSPITGLPEVLQRYNSSMYPDTGVYTVLACLEDYMDLVSFHRDKLPVVAFDPNPNFMGFYFSRPKLKEGCRKLISNLLTAEKLLFCDGQDTRNMPEIEDKMASAWEMAVVTNHHDFITGTSPNRVHDKEQMPWVRKANQMADDVLETCSSTARERGSAPSRRKKTSEPSWRRDGCVLKVESPYYALELDERRGGCITSFVDSASGRQVLSGYGNDLVLYEDSGGLWRMGCEFSGGKFKEIARSSMSRALVNAVERDGILQITIKSQVGPTWLTRQMWFAAESPLIWMRTIGSLTDYRTVTCRFDTAIKTDVISMDVAGGVVDRPLVKTFNPTFWSAQSFAHYRNEPDGFGLALFTGLPSTVSGKPGGEIEWVVARNARRERAFGFLRIPAFPARGADPSIQVMDYAILLTTSGDWRDNGLHLLASNAASPAWRDPAQSALKERAERAVKVDNEHVRVVAVKPASVGEGSIARLFSYANEPLTVHLEAAPGKIARASLCDAMERDLRPLEIKNGKALVPITRNITSLRLILS